MQVFQFSSPTHCNYILELLYRRCYSFCQKTNAVAATANNWLLVGEFAWLILLISSIIVSAKKLNFSCIAIGNICAAFSSYMY